MKTGQGIIVVTVGVMLAILLSIGGCCGLMIVGSQKGRIGREARERSWDRAHRHRWATVEPLETFVLDDDGRWRVEILERFVEGDACFVVTRMTSLNKEPLSRSSSQWDLPRVSPGSQVVEGVELNLDEDRYGVPEGRSWRDPDIIRSGDSQVEVTVFRPRADAESFTVLFSCGGAVFNDSRSFRWSWSDFRSTSSSAQD